MRRPRLAEGGWLGLVGVLLFLGLVLVAAFAPWLAPRTAGEMVRLGDGGVARLLPPGPGHPFGTTSLGRDVLSQVILGTRGALLVAVAAALSVVTVGTVVGMMAGYFRRATGTILMRATDVAYALPLEPTAIVLLALTTPSIWTTTAAISMLAWRDVARVVRAQVLSTASRPFVKAASLSGAGHARIMVLHILPNILPLVLVYLPISGGRAILAEAAISFLGYGDPRILTWGQMLQEAFISGAARQAWWWILAPGLAINLAVLSIFFASRFMEEALNPRLAYR
jgi:peptide/nickel transport system permease protein